jgi:hypothetical protein
MQRRVVGHRMRGRRCRCLDEGEPLDPVAWRILAAPNPPIPCLALSRYATDMLMCVSKVHDCTAILKHTKAPIQCYENIFQRTLRIPKHFHTNDRNRRTSDTN